MSLKPLALNALKRRREVKIRGFRVRRFGVSTGALFVDFRLTWGSGFIVDGFRQTYGGEGFRVWVLKSPSLIETCRSLQNGGFCRACKAG